MNQKRMMINLIAQIFSFIVSTGISFFLSPYLIANVGKEAYGYFNLANNFVGYAQVITVALNSMASRFITIKIHQKDDEGRNKYFSSVFIANAMISVLLMAVFSVIIVFLDRLFEISQNIVVDVKLLWCFVCVSFIINIIFNVFSVATFAKDRLDLASLRTIESNVIRAVLLAGIFGLCVPKVWYLGFVTFVTSIYIIIWNIHYTKTMLPGIKISKSLFDHEAIKSLLSSGLWNSFTQLSSILSTGLDLLITNIWVGPLAMGTVSISKTIPTMILSFFAQIAHVFAPQLTISYAKGDIDGMKQQLIFVMKLLGMIASIPMAILIAYGGELYSLWLPGEDGRLLQSLSIVSCFAYIFVLPLEVLWNIFTVTNKVKASAIFLFVGSVATTLGVLVGVNVVESELLKMYIIVGISTIVSIIRALTFLPMYGAKCLNLKIYTFYPQIIKNTVSVIIITGVAFFIKRVWIINSWLYLFLDCCILGVIAIVANYQIIFTREEKLEFKNMLLKKIRKNK